MAGEGRGASGAPVIETAGLTKDFGDVRAVDGLDLTVGAGEMFALVGPDGSGKTTTIRMLCGILQPTAGRISILGRELPREAAAVRSDIGYLSQRFSLYGDLTVDENIAFFAEIHGVRDYAARRDELLEFSRLTPFRKRLGDRLSGGMKQKLALACTLIHTPRLLLLDEPTTGVDPVSRRDFWKILSNLLKTGITILMSTPYLDEAERCSRVGLMNAGRLVAADTPGAVKKLMKGEVVEIVCDEIRRAYEVLKGRTGAREVQLFGDRLNLVVDDARRDLPELIDRLREAGVAVRDHRVVPPTLENVFISVTGPSGPAEQEVHP
jgi:ABC-2 type transport system ATP-binding protein